MRKTKNNLALQENFVDVNLPSPHINQSKILLNDKRFKIVSAGRRFGKTELGKIYLVSKAMLGYPVAWIAPSYKVLLEVYSDLILNLSSVITAKSYQNKIIDLVGGGKIELWSAETEYPCESRKYKAVVIDEAAAFPKLKQQWENSIRPTLTDYKGNALLISTPKGLNYFYDLWRNADENDTACFHFTSYDNPFLDPAEIDKAKRDLPSIVFQQEYLAEFVTGAGAYVKREWLKYEEDFNLQNYSEIKMGVDLAFSKSDAADYSAIAVVGRRASNPYALYVLDVDRVKESFQNLKELIIRKAAYYKPQRIIIEATQAQEWLVQELIRETTLPVVPIKPQTDKISRATNLLAKYENGLIYHAIASKPQQKEFEDELLSFPIGKHDDMVDALVYAVNDYAVTAARIGAI